MPTKRTVLAVDVTSDPADAVRGFDQVASSAVDMANDVARSVAKVDDVGRGMDGVADSADNLASKSSQATGGLGALASGFSLVGAEKYAGALEGAAMATDFFSGVGDIANLVLESQAVQTAKATALKIKDTVVTRGQAIATGAMTIAQRALNLAMSASPLGLVIVAITTLIGLFVVLYTRNERFRALVQRVMAAVSGFVGRVVDRVRDLAGWFRAKIPAAAATMRDLLVAYVKFMTLPIRVAIGLALDLAGWFRDKVPAAAGALRDKVASIVSVVNDRIASIRTKIGNVVDAVRGTFSSVWSGAADAAKTAVGSITDVFRGLYDWIQDIIDKIGDLIGKIKGIKIPDLTPGFDLPGIPGLLKSEGGGRGIPVSTGVGQPINIYLQGLMLDPMTAARQIIDLLRQYGYTVNGLQVTP